MDICATVCLTTLYAVADPDPEVRSCGMVQCCTVQCSARPDLEIMICHRWYVLYSLCSTDWNTSMKVFKNILGKC